METRVWFAESLGLRGLKEAIKEAGCWTLATKVTTGRVSGFAPLHRSIESVVRHGETGSANRRFGSFPRSRQEVKNRVGYGLIEARRESADCANERFRNAIGTSSTTRNHRGLVRSRWPGQSPADHAVDRSLSRRRRDPAAGVESQNCTAPGETI